MSNYCGFYLDFNLYLCTQNFQLYANEQKEYSTLKWFCRLHLQLL